jgi:hypothetical protein
MRACVGDMEMGWEGSKVNDARPREEEEEECS